MNKKKLRLPDVTLVMFENMEHELARLAVQDCFDVADFGDALILTDKPECFPFKDCRFPKVSWSGKMGWARSVWFDLPPLVHTSHMLLLQWDAWIWDASKWQDRFLGFDLIGSPWWYTDGKNVGNTGFALKTTALARYIRDHREKFPCNTGTEDDLLCRTYRPELERLGFTWAPEKLAHEFARECSPPTA
ncbi:MAG TPA: DUF5672 family protein, partial [Anaerolineae bacterium]|nr:DUF5672 family protein [Anaerolineae bacterium]